MNKSLRQFNQKILERNEFTNNIIKTRNLKIIHFRNILYPKTLAVKPLNKNSKLYEVAIARCPIEVAFNKKIGKIIAVERFEIGAVIVLHKDEIYNMRFI